MKKKFRGEHSQNTSSILRTIASATPSISVGQAVVSDGANVILANSANLATVLTHAGIATSAGSAGAEISIIHHGLVDPTIFNLGGGLACAVGTDSSGNVVRIIDGSYASDFKYLGYCDTHGTITIMPKVVENFNVKDFGAFGDGTGGSGADQIAFNAMVALLSSSDIGGIGYIGGHIIHIPAGHYKLTEETSIPVNMPIIIEGEGQATTLIEWTTISNGFALHSPYGETRIANIVIRDLQLYNSATISYAVYSGGNYWKPTTSYTVGNVVALPGHSNRLLQCTSSGTSGAYTPFGTLWSGDPTLPYLYITGTPAAQYDGLLVQIYDTGTIGGGLTIKYATDGVTLGAPLTPSGTTLALGATGLTLNLQDVTYEQSHFYAAPPDGAGFGNIVGDIITDGTVTWEVIDGGVGLLFENGAQIKIERTNIVGFVLCAANDGCDNFFIDDSCNFGNNNGVWGVSGNERNNGFPTMFTATTGSGSLSSTPTTVNVGTTTSAPSSGTFYIIGTGDTGSVLVTYTSTSPTSFNGCTALSSSYNTKAYVSIPVEIQQSTATNIMGVGKTEIFNYGIGIADSGGFNHKYSMINFESSNTIGRSTSIWANGIQGGEFSGFTGEGAYRCASLGSTAPFTGAIQENGTVLEFVRFEGECDGDSGIVLKTGPGVAYKSISFKHSFVNCQTSGVPCVYGIGWVLGFRSEDSEFPAIHGTGLFDITQTATSSGVFLFEQTMSSDQPGIGYNCLPENTVDISGSFGLHTRTITAAYTVDAGVNPDYSPDHTILMSGGPYTVTLPPTQTKRRKLLFKAIDGSAVTYTIAQNSSETIDGNTSYAITLKYGSIELTCDGTNYWVTASYNGTVI